MSVPSVSPVASSASSAQVPAQPDVPGDAADTSPFAMLLAAIAAADPALQASVLQPPAQQLPLQPEAAQAVPPADAQSSAPPAPRIANHDPANDDDADATVDPTVNVAQISSSDPSDIKVDGGKPAKKENTDKGAADLTALPAPPQYLATPPIPPMVQAALQTQTVAGNDDDSEVPAIADLRASGAAATPLPSTLPPDGGPGGNAAQPVSSGPSQINGNQAAALAVAANDDDADDGEVLSNAGKAAQISKAANGAGLNFSQLRNPASPAAPQAPVPGDDADADSEPAQPSAANTTPQSAAQVLQTEPNNAAAVFLAQQAPPKPDASGKREPGSSGDVVLPGAKAISTNGKDPAQNIAPAATEDAGSDNKPAHAAAITQPQTASAEPPPNPAMEAVPQAAIAITASAGHAPGGLTLSVHIANHDSDFQSSAPQAAIPDTDSLAISIAARSLSGSRQFDIRLDPPELGRVEVRLSIDASGKTQAHMTADQPRTLELLQKDAPNLTRALRDAGLDVSQSGLNFSLKGQGQHPGQNNGGQNGNFGAPGRGLSLPAIAQGIEAAQSAGALPSLSGNARLDIHV